MRTSDLSEAWKSGRATSKDLAKTFAEHARGAADDVRGRAHDFRDSAWDAFSDLKDRAASMTSRASKSSSGLPFSLGEARSFGRRNAKLLTAGGAVLGLAAGGALAWALLRRARDKKLAADGATADVTPADQLGRDPAFQGESAGLAAFAEPEAATFPLAGARKAKSRTSASTEH